MSSSSATSAGSPIRVILVDDSSSVRKALAEIIDQEKDICVIDQAGDGRHGLRLTAQRALKNDPAEVVLLDIEMPVLDGLSALEHFTNIHPTPKIIMASSLTKRGAAASLRALTMGASDYVCKPGNGQNWNTGSFKEELISKIRCWGKAARRNSLFDQQKNTAQEGAKAKTDNEFSFGPRATKKERAISAPILPNKDSSCRQSDSSSTNSRSRIATKRPANTNTASQPNVVFTRKLVNTDNRKTETNETVFAKRPIGNKQNPKATINQRSTSLKSDNISTKCKKRIKAIAIGGSTGAPQALHTILKELRAVRGVPIFITQHMPESFTAILAEQLGKTSDRTCAEGQNDEIVQADNIYVAPGGFHMTVKSVKNDMVIHTDQGPPENFCRPSVDPMFRSLATSYGSGLLSIILTGMGQDGLEGCKAIRAAQGDVIVQDEESSVVWGMPGAVAKAGLADHIVSLRDIAPLVKQQYFGI